MSSAPWRRRRRRSSMDQGLDFAGLREGLAADTESFTRQLEEQESRMAAAVGDMMAVSAEVSVQETSQTLRTAGVVKGGVRVAVGVGLGLFVCAAPFIGGLSLAIAAAVVGGATVAVVNVANIMKMNGGAARVEELGGELMQIIQPMTAQLEGLQACGGQGAEPAEHQAGKVLADVEELQEALQQLAELRRRSRGAAGGAAGAAVRDQLCHLLALVASAWTSSDACQLDVTLAQAIVQSAMQGEKVNAGFHLMREELQSLAARWAEPEEQLQGEGRPPQANIRPAPL